MSLRSDFELCLKYAEALENKQEQLARVQNNIIFVQNESERLKNKLRLCTVLSVLSGVGILGLSLRIFSVQSDDRADFFPLVLILLVVFGVSLLVRIKTRKESGEMESQKNRLIRQYTQEAEVYEREIDGLVQEIYREDLFDIVPAEYFCVAAIDFCLTRIRQKMANSASEVFWQLDAEIKHLEQTEHLEQMNDARVAELNGIKRAIQVHTLVTLLEQNKYKY